MRFSYFFIRFFSIFCFFSSTLKAQFQENLAHNRKEVDAIFFNLNENLKQEQKNGTPYAIAIARYQMGVFCQEHGVYTEAIDQFHKAMLLVEKQEQDSLYSNLFNRLGSIHMELKNYDTAETYFQKGIIASKTKSSLALSKSNLGACYEKKGNYIKALAYQNESLEVYSTLKNAQGISVVNENIGSIYEDLESYAIALGYFEKALAFHAELKDARLANILNNIGDIYRKTGSLENGLVYTKKALAIAQLIGDSEEEASAYKDVSKNYKLSGNFEEAFKALNSFLALDEENSRRHNSNQASALQTIYDAKERESQIQLLLQNRKVDKAQKNLLIFAILVFILVVVIWFLYIRRKRREAQKLLTYEKRILKVELDKKKLQEQNLQKEVYLKNSALSRYSLHLSQKNKMLSNLSQTLKNSIERTNIDLKRKLNELIKEIDFNLSQEQEWDEFMAFFKEIHPEYLKKITTMASETLSQAELRLSILLRLNLSSKEIAAILRLTPDSVRVARYRLRKKLPLNSKAELSAFLMTI